MMMKVRNCLSKINFCRNTLLTMMPSYRDVFFTDDGISTFLSIPNGLVDPMLWTNAGHSIPPERVLMQSWMDLFMMLKWRRTQSLVSKSPRLCQVLMLIWWFQSRPGKIPTSMTRRKASLPTCISRTLKSIMRARVLSTTLSMAPRKNKKQKGRVRQKVVFECLLDVGFCYWQMAFR